MYADQEVIDRVKEWYLGEAAYHVREKGITDKGSYCEGLEPNPIPNFEE